MGTPPSTIAAPLPSSGSPPAELVSLPAGAGWLPSHGHAASRNQTSQVRLSGPRSGRWARTSQPVRAQGGL